MPKKHFLAAAAPYLGTCRARAQGYTCSAHLSAFDNASSSFEIQFRSYLAWKGLLTTQGLPEDLAFSIPHPNPVHTCPHSIPGHFGDQSSPSMGPFTLKCASGKCRLLETPGTTKLLLLREGAQESAFWRPHFCPAVLLQCEPPPLRSVSPTAGLCLLQRVPGARLWSLQALSGLRLITISLPPFFF